MAPPIPPERLPKVIFLLRLLREAPQNMRIVKGERVTFTSIIKWVKRRNPELYHSLLRAYNCDDDSCLARGLAMVFLNIAPLLSFNGGQERVGELYGAAGRLAEELSRYYPIRV